MGSLSFVNATVLSVLNRTIHVVGTSFGPAQPGRQAFQIAKFGKTDRFLNIPSEYWRRAKNMCQRQVDVKMRSRQRAFLFDPAPRLAIRDYQTIPIIFFE